MKVFLGGTCNESTWRDELIPMLTNVDYFNPVVEDWTEECMVKEIEERKTCDYCLYTITPRMMGVYSIAEVVDDSNKRSEKTIFAVLDSDIGEDGNIITWGKAEKKSLTQVAKMVERNGGHFFMGNFNVLKDLANWLNNR